MNPARILRYAAAAAGAGLAGFGGYAAVAWARYGRADPRRHPRDELLDRFLSNPEVDEYHRLNVRAPAAVTFAAARQMDIQASFRPPGSRGIVAETLDQGWGVLAEVPDREIVVGAYTQPWHEHVTFHPLPPEEFAAFSEPGYVKIIWTLAAEPAGPGESWFITRTRAATTDADSRKKFRRYWAPMSAGIILIRCAALPLVRRQAERQARQADKVGSQTVTGHGG